MNAETKFSRSQLDHMYQEHMVHGFLQSRRQEIEQSIRALGADSFDVLLPETRMLPVVTDSNETIEGIVYGRYQKEDDMTLLVGRGALVATNRRVLLIDRKFLYMRYDEIEFEVISGISFASVWPMTTVTLRTRQGDIKLRTFNRQCAENFVAAIEERLFE